MQFSVLGSGSAGNSAVVSSGETFVMVDAGFSAKQLTLRLDRLGIAPEQLSAIVLTHEHGDHTKGLDVFLRKRSVPVFCNLRTRAVLGPQIKSAVEWKLFDDGDHFQVGPLGFRSFYVPHDAAGPTGYLIEHESTSCRLGFLSDVGHVTTLIRERLAGVDTLFVEANYDDVMLQNDTRRPWSTKQRISSPHGHLSNAQTAELVSEIAAANLHRVVLGHLSRDCNAPEEASRAVVKALGAVGHRSVDVVCAVQNEVLPFVPVARRAVEPLISPRSAVAVEPAQGASPPAPSEVGPWETSPAWEAHQALLFDPGAAAEGA